MDGYQEIIRYESRRKSVGVRLSQFATIRQLERPFAEELARVLYMWNLWSHQRGHLESRADLSLASTFKWLLCQVLCLSESYKWRKLRHIRWYWTWFVFRRASHIYLADGMRFPGSSLTVQLHLLLTKAKMTGPKSVNLAKRDRLIDLTEAARDLPTIVISLQPRAEKKVAFIENGAKRRKVQWLTSWDDVV